jgi:hypothetical protein
MNTERSRSVDTRPNSANNLSRGSVALHVHEDINAFSKGLALLPLHSFLGVGNKESVHEGWMNAENHSGGSAREETIDADADEDRDNVVDIVPCQKFISVTNERLSRSCHLLHYPHSAESGMSNKLTQSTPVWEIL